MLLAIEERAHELGYDLLVAHTLNSEAREAACIQRLLSRPRGRSVHLPRSIASGPTAPNSTTPFEQPAPCLGVIILGHASPFCRQFVTVETDDLIASYGATQHLLHLGHKRIAYFAGPQAAPWAQGAIRGLPPRAPRIRDRGFDDRLVFQSGNTIEDGAKAALQFINEAPAATAIQAVTDLIAIGCANTLLNQGVRIPARTSPSCGFGNLLTSGDASASLSSTVRQPKFRLGIAAMEVMVKMLRGERPETRRLKAEVVARQSTAPPPPAPA